MIVPPGSLWTCVLSDFSCVRLFVTLWTVAHQVPLSMGVSRQEYWSELPFSPPGDLPNPGIEHVSLTSPALGGRFFTTSATWEAPYRHISSIKRSGRRCANLLTVACIWRERLEEKRVVSG